MTVQTCPKCGGQEFGKGKQNGYGHMYPVGRISLIGTEIQHIICTSCGLIVESFVTDPERFKGTIKS